VCPSSQPRALPTLSLGGLRPCTLFSPSFPAVTFWEDFCFFHSLILSIQQVVGLKKKKERKKRVYGHMCKEHRAKLPAAELLGVGEALAQGSGTEGLLFSQCTSPPRASSQILDPCSWQTAMLKPFVSENRENHAHV
jgi:hypothetical protein